MRPQIIIGTTKFACLILDQSAQLKLCVSSHTRWHCISLTNPILCTLLLSKSVMRWNLHQFYHFQDKNGTCADFHKLSDLFIIKTKSASAHDEPWSSSTNKLILPQNAVPPLSTRMIDPPSPRVIAPLSSMMKAPLHPRVTPEYAHDKQNHDHNHDIAPLTNLSFSLHHAFH